MTDTDYVKKLDELDRLLNDPEVPMEPHRIWNLLAEISRNEPMTSPGRAEAGRGA